MLNDKLGTTPQIESAEIGAVSRTGPIRGRIMPFCYIKSERMAAILRRARIVLANRPVRLARQKNPAAALVTTPRRSL
jgi:hypothetical protein